MPSKRQRRKRAAEKAEVNRTRDDNFRRRVERTTANKCAAAELPCRNAHAGGSSMLAGAEVAPEFEMTDTRAAGFKLGREQDSLAATQQHVVSTQKDAGDAPEFILGTTHAEETCRTKPAVPATPNDAQHIANSDVARSFDADPPMMVAAKQLLQQLQLAEFPAEWDSPIVQPLLLEVLTERAKKIMTARKRRSKRRDNRKLKW